MVSSRWPVARMARGRRGTVDLAQRWLLLKACPRCERGDIHRDRDQYGEFWQCVQCGWMRDLPGQTDRFDQWRRQGLGG